MSVIFVISQFYRGFMFLRGYNQRVIFAISHTPVDSVRFLYDYKRRVIFVISQLPANSLRFLHGYKRRVIFVISQLPAIFCDSCMATSGV